MPAPLNLGMVGGAGPLSIGPTHRFAARLDGQWNLVAGGFSRDRERNRALASEVGIDPSRVYSDYREMFAAEAARSDGIVAVAVVTPNATHHSICRAAIDAGLHVICVKPIAVSLAEGRDLVSAATRSGIVFAVTHGFAAYPMVREARRLVAAGALGAVRLVESEFLSGWMAAAVETRDPRAAWRLDPAEAGLGGILADLGTHAFHLACMVSGLTPEAVLAELLSIVPGRRLDDDVRAWIRFAGNGRGTLRVGTTAIGNASAIRLRVCGEKGGLDWLSGTPDTLLFQPLGEPTRVLMRGALGEGPASRASTRVASGHPEGLIGAFADIYTAVARAIRDRTLLSPDFAGVRDGALGLAFVEAAVESHRRGNVWIPIPEVR